MFDGYEDSPSTKDVTETCVGQKINFSDNIAIMSKKEDSFADKDNKQNFIYLLNKKLLQAECVV